MFPSSSFLSLLCPDRERCWRGVMCHFSHTPKNTQDLLSNPYSYNYNDHHATNDSTTHSHNKQSNFHSLHSYSHSHPSSESRRPLKRWKGDENFVDEDSDEDSVIVIDEEEEEREEEEPRVEPVESLPTPEMQPENDERTTTTPPFQLQLKSRKNLNKANMNVEEAYDPFKPELNQNFLLSQDAIKTIKLQHESLHKKPPTTTTESKKWNFSLNTSSTPANSAQNTPTPIPPKPTTTLFKPPPSSNSSEIPIAVSKKYTEHKVNPKDEKLKNGIPVSEYPVIPIEFRAAIPRVARQALLDKLLIAYLKRNPKDRALAIKKAVNAEQKVQSKSAASKNVYATFGARKLKAVTQNQEESDDDE